MTITSSTSRTQYTGNGVTTNFATGFYFTENSQVKALKTVISTGVDTELVNPTDFSVTGALNPSGGTVTCVVAPLGTERLTIYRTDDFVQEVNLTAYENFPAETVEDALDKLTIQTTQLLDATNRSLQFSEGSTVSSAFTIETPIANRGLKYNASGTGIINTTDDPDGIVAAAAASASAAASSASSAATSAGTATTQAGIATTQASNASTSASSASTSATNASNSASSAATSATNAENSALSVGARLVSTSTTSMSIGTGSKTCTVQTSEGWAVGMFITVYRTSDITQFMVGQITAYNTGTGQLDFTVSTGNTNGSGTYTDWTVVVGGRRGVDGSAAGTVFVSGADTTQNNLNAKIAVVGMTKTILNPSGNEQLQLTAITKIKQIATGTLAGDNGFASSSTSFTDTGLTASITPTSASNKILVMWSGGANYVTNGSAGTGKFRTLRGATPIDGAAGTKELVVGGSNLTNQEFNVPITRLIIDAPATTSTLTYKVQGKTSNTGHTLKLSEYQDSFIILVEYEP